MFLVPTSRAEDWKNLLADPDKHWREGYSAHALATRWEAAGGLPVEVRALFEDDPAFAGLQMLLGMPEHKVALPGGARPSQTDLWVLARTREELLSIAVEGKVRESFGPTLDEWMSDKSQGKTTRWLALCDLLSLAQDCDRSLRYQLVHRTASAILEAQRFRAPKAALVVHSFSGNQDGFGDFQKFAGHLGASVSSPGRIHRAESVSGIELFVGWAQGPVAVRSPADS
jgi:hypothetical protein